MGSEYMRFRSLHIIYFSYQHFPPCKLLLQDLRRNTKRLRDMKAVNRIYFNFFCRSLQNKPYLKIIVYHMQRYMT